MSIFRFPVANLIKSFNKLQEQAKAAVDERTQAVQALEEQKTTLEKELTLARNVQDLLANLQLGK